MHDTFAPFSLAPLAVAMLFVLSGLMAIGSNVVLAQDLSASSIVELTTASGRTFRGKLSPKSNFDTVRITSSRGSIELTRPIAWKTIRELTINEQPATFEQLKTLIHRVHEDESAGDSTPGLISIGPSQTISNENEVAVEQLEANQKSAPVASLSAWATYKNWDSDPSVDGLEVTFSAEDAQGMPTAARGYLEAELYAFQDQSYSAVPHGRGARFERIGSWRISLNQTTARYDSRVARLPYQGNSPVTDGRISSAGILVMRLVIPGQGTFSASLDDVRLRPYSAIRDSNQLSGNPRFMGQENPRYRPYKNP
ncbi:hypothetical protein [Blastopirellula marina]|uniref:Uncharacterized protein n=1 Tax=Blastopirellula marina TaxID=124 RepID=A0A2S8G2E0_9BACT|nr:hypothetical protein [Blastopirellula marina]PQO38470.1 hypothetical protein C5Y98_10465 [Blastopirellula marina]PTL45127.1 hypothetical protein C5Y97_10475 [Blastopirellula marina]